MIVPVFSTSRSRKQICAQRGVQKSAEAASIILSLTTLIFSLDNTDERKVSLLFDTLVLVLYSSAQSGKTRKITHAGFSSPARHFPGKSKTLPTGDLSVWEEAIFSSFFF